MMRGMPPYYGRDYFPVPAQIEPRGVVGSAMDDSHKNPNKVFVGGLSQSTTAQSLRDYMKQFGKVVDAAVVTDKMTGRSRGFGFCSFGSEEIVDRCLGQKHHLEGAQLDIRRAVPRNETTKSNSSPPMNADLPGKVFIGGIPEAATEEHLKDFFEQFGPVKQVTIIRDKTANKSRGFGFMYFENPEDADRAVGEHPMLHHTIEVKKATPRPGNQNARSGKGIGGYDRFSDQRGAYGGPEPYGSDCYSDSHGYGGPPGGGGYGGGPYGGGPYAAPYGDSYRRPPPYGEGYGSSPNGYGHPYGSAPHYGGGGYGGVPYGNGYGGPPARHMDYGGPQRAGRYGGGSRTQPY